MEQVWFDQYAKREKGNTPSYIWAYYTPHLGSNLKVATQMFAANLHKYTQLPCCIEGTQY